MPAANSPIINPPRFSANGWFVVVALGLLGWTAATPLAPGADGSISSIAEREVARRQGQVKNAEGQLGEGLLLLEKGKAEEAAKSLLTAYEGLPAVPVTEDVRGRLRKAYASAACVWAKSLLDEGRRAEALKVVEQVLDEDVDPSNGDALNIRKWAADTDRYPAALTPQHIANAKEVTRLLTLAASHADLGRYDKAVETYRDALRIDPYNTAARRGMERVEQRRTGYLQSARDHARSKLLGAVDAGWEDPLPISQSLTDLFSASNGGGEVQVTNRDLIEKKLRTLYVPKVQFTEASLDEVVDYLRVTSRNVDPTGRGVDFIVNLEGEARERKLSLNLTNVPLEELVRYVTQNVNAVYRIEPNAVVIGSLTERSTTLISKTYKVPPDFIQTAAVDPGAGAGGAPADPFAAGKKGTAATPTADAGIQVRRMGAKEFLEGRGVSFPEGANATFSGGSSTLLVRNTADNIAIVDTLVDTALTNGSKQAVISVKMVDISQTRLDELGFDWMTGAFNLPGSNRVYGSGGGIGNQGSADAFASAMPGGGDPTKTLMTAGLRSSGAILGKPSIDGLIAAKTNANTIVSTDSRSPSQFALLGYMTDPQFQVAIRALNQSKGVDLVSQPSITTKSGQKASVRVVREFPYPTEFDPPQIPQSIGQFQIGNVRINTGDTANPPITPSTPTAFAVKEIGTVLEVEPVISGDGRTIEMSITPSDVEFEGFIDYGSPINTDIGTLDETHHENHIYQPVFRTTRTTTSVNVYDGSTVVIGGVVNEKKTDINDKVPLIGDLPLVGRFWQSKVTQTEKRCVMFFVTVKVIDPGGNRISQATAGAQ